MTYSADDVIAEINELLEKIEVAEADIGEAVYEYTTSVRTQAESMRDWITQNNRATDNQVRAVRNWTRGLDKWMNSRRLV